MWNTLGFEKIKKFFENNIEAGRLSHAYLFTGQEMIGKRTLGLELARNFSKLVIDPSASESGKTIGIEEIKNVKNFLGLSSFGGGKKIALINDAHLMTHEAQNALLKILEEPSLTSHFILITANSSQLLPTVVSRCQEIRFPTHSRQTIKEYLDKSKINQKQADFLFALTNGRIGLLKKIIEGENLDGMKEAIGDWSKILSADINTRIAMAQKMTDEKNGSDLQKKILYWILYMRSRIKDPKSAKILKGLLALHHKNNQPQFNQRLMLESFLISV